MGFRQDKTQVLTGDDTHGMVSMLVSLIHWLVKLVVGLLGAILGLLGGILKLLGSIYPSRARPLYLA